MALRSSFYVIQFRTAQGWQVSRSFTQIRNARKMLDWYLGQSWTIEAAIYRGGQGGSLVAA